MNKIKFLIFTLLLSISCSATSMPAIDIGICHAYQKASKPLIEAGGASRLKFDKNSAKYEIERGSIFEKEGDVENAKVWYLRAARRGDSVGEYNVGRLCAQGEEGRYQPDYACASKWLSLSALNNNRDAQYALGMQYFGGIGVPQDYKLAKTWIEKSALNGSVRAKNMLGNLYQGGIGLDRNYRLATFWYRSAANEDLAEAQARMGVQYLYGYGVNRDELSALTWFLIAKDHGASVGDVTLNKIERHLGPSGVIEAKKMAKKWYCNP